jgi:hypothetical protein
MLIRRLEYLIVARIRAVSNFVGGSVKTPENFGVRNFAALVEADTESVCSLLSLPSFYD